MRTTQLIILILLLAGLLAACTPAVDVPDNTQPEVVEPQPIVATDARGQTFEFAQPVQRIISLAPSNTEILFAIGAGAQVVGRDSFSDYPAEALAVTDIGGGFGTLSIEVIVTARPDLVLAGDLTPAEQIQTLEDLGLTVFVLGNPLNMAEMYDNLFLVARMTGHTAETETLVASLQAREAAVVEKLAGISERPVVLYELDGTDPNAPWVPGPGTFIDTLITQAGGINMSASLEGAWVQMSLEAIIEMDPDLILLGDATWGGVTPEMVAARGGWDALEAVQEGKVFPFDDNLVSRPGPRLVDGLESMAALLHPDLFK